MYGLVELCVEVRRILVYRVWYVSDTMGVWEVYPSRA
jgi:hypothetical protein